MANKDLTVSNLIGTLKNTFKINLATLSASALTAARTFTLQDRAGTIALTTPRVGSTTSSATPTINTDNVDIYRLTAQTVDITSFTTNLSGTPTDGQKLTISVTGTDSRTITWGSSFTGKLPATTLSTATLTVNFVYSSALGKWFCHDFDSWPIFATRWRVNFLSSVAGGNCALAKIELHETVGGSDVASGGTASASSVYSSYVASNAFDADANTFWASVSGFNEWIEYKLASLKYIAEIVLKARNDAYSDQAPKEFYWEYFDELTKKWVILFHKEGISSWSAGQSRTYSQ